MNLCDVPLISAACDAVTNVAANSGIQWIGDLVTNGAANLFQGMWVLMDATTLVDVTTGAYTRVYNLVFGIAVVVMLGFFLLQLITAMVRREPGALARAALGLGKGMLGSFVALTLTATLLEVVDRLSLALVDAAGTTMEGLGERVGVMLLGGGFATLAAPGLSVLFGLFVGVLAVCATFILWISLLVRKALVLLAIVFAPIAMTGSVWDPTRQWVSRWASFVIALALSKLVIVVLFLLATAQASTPISGDLASLSEPVSAVVLMLIAGFAPYMTYKAITFIGFDMYHAMSAEQEAKGALNRSIPLPTPRLPSSISRVIGSRTTPASAPPGPAATGVGAPSPGGVGGAVGGASSGAAAATGVGAAVVASAAAVKGAAKAGPNVGAVVAGSAQHHGEGSSTTTSPAPPPPPSSPTTPPPPRPTTPPPPRPTSPRPSDSRWN